MTATALASQHYPERWTQVMLTSPPATFCCRYCRLEESSQKAFCSLWRISLSVPSSAVLGVNFKAK
jgi:hypothetical protein